MKDMQVMCSLLQPSQPSWKNILQQETDAVARVWLQQETDAVAPQNLTCARTIATNPIVARLAAAVEQRAGTSHSHTGAVDCMRQAVTWFAGACISLDLCSCGHVHGRVSFVCQVR